MNTELEAIGRLDTTLNQLRGLASCLVVLGEAITADGIKNVLIDDALPMLGEVMYDLTQRAVAARREIEGVRIERRTAAVSRGGIAATR